MRHEIVTDTLSGVEIVGTRDGLSALRHPGSAAVFWQRSLPLEVQQWLDGLDPDNLPRARVVLPPEAVEATVADLCAAHGMAPSVERDWFVQDVAMMAKTFLRVMPAPYLRMRLDVVTTDACRRFHTDAVMARLVCTYRGTGTQYGISRDGGAPNQIHTVPTGAPIMLRGTLWPEEPSSGLLHRSPPIAGTGETRLVLVLDPMTEPEEEF